MSTHAHILVVEDESSIADNIIFALKAESFSCQWLSLAHEAVECVRKGGVDLVLLDVGLPDISGFEACKAIRQFSNVPIIFLTARGDEIDRVVGFEIGADDYVIKPFSPRELSARVKARLRRSNEATPIKNALQEHSKEQQTRGAFFIDDNKKQISFCNTPLKLTAYEYRILQHLLAQPDRVYSREQLIDKAWVRGEVVLGRSVDTHIKSLRNKLLSVNGELNPIKTHRGIGYSVSTC